MKNISKYFALAFTGLLMAACDGDYTDWSAPQSYDQENAITIPGFTATGAAAIDIATAGDNVKAFTLSDATLPEGFVLQNARMELVPEGVEGTENAIVQTTVDGMASAADIQAVIEKYYGKRPTARVFDVHVYVNAVKNGQALLIDAGTVKLTATPEAPQISESYYIIGAPSEWNPQCTTLKFSHSGKDVYDDPVFTITFPVSATDKTWFAISDALAAEKYKEDETWSYVFGCVEGNGNNGMEGKLDRRVNLGDDGSWKVDAGVAKFVKMTINMMDYTYKLEYLNFQEYLYVAGSGNGWQHVDMVSSPKFDGNYTGFMNLGNEFKFCTQPDWSGTSYGENFSTDGGAGNMTLPAGYAEGYYMVKMSLADQTLNLTEITTIGVIGTATPQGWDASTSLTYNAAGRCWEGDITFTDGEFKFRANDGWDISWGGSFDNLTTEDGANMLVTAGTYHVALYPNCPGKAYCTLTAK